MTQFSVFLTFLFVFLNGVAAGYLIAGVK